MSYFAPGIKNKRKFGDLNLLKPGDILDYVLQRHLAQKAGPHIDVRFGSPKTNLFSWATRKPLPEEGKSIGLYRQPLHEYSYKDFEGMIPPGYGHGPVWKLREGKLLITLKDPKGNIHFTIADRQIPERYLLVAPKERGPRRNLLVRAKLPSSLDVEKPKFKEVKTNQIPSILSKLTDKDIVQTKIDGALSLVNIPKNKIIEILSHRISKITGRPVVQTERFFGQRPIINVPESLTNSVLLGEMYGVRKGKAIPIQELGGILNSVIAKSLAYQKDKDIQLKTMLFDIVKEHGKDVSHLPYAQRLELLRKYMKYLPKDKFHLPETVRGPEKAMELYRKIKAHKHPLTVEGLIIRKAENDEPIKAKLFKEHNVYIRDIFPGEGKYKGKAAGGFWYSLTPHGPIVGKVGTGLSDIMRKMLWENPKEFIGRVARIQAQSQFKNTGAFRAPSFLALEEAK